MRKYYPEAFVVAFAVLISTTAVSAFAQGDVPEMPDFDPGSFQMPEEVSGTYTNEEAGVTITFPADWSGYSFSFSNMTMASVAPGGMDGEEEPKKMIALIVAAKSEVQDPTDPDQYSQQEDSQECSTPTPSQTTVSGKRAYEMTMECTIDGETTKMKMTLAESADNWINAMYVSPSAEFDADVSKYDTAVDSLQIQGAVDATVPTIPPTTGGGSTTDDGSNDDDGMEASMMPVTVGEDSIDVSVQSSSTISDFALNEESKTLSFTADGSGDKTVISVGAVLQGPYTVMVDGQAKDDFEESTDSDGVKTISVPHASGSHDVTITGTQVVPEFPIALLGIMAAVIVAMVSIVGRTSLFKGRI